MSKVSDLIIKTFASRLKLKVIPSGSVSIDNNNATSNVNKLYEFCEPVLGELAKTHSNEIMPIFTTMSRRDALKANLLGLLQEAGRIQTTITMKRKLEETGAPPPEKIKAFIRPYDTENGRASLFLTTRTGDGLYSKIPLQPTAFELLVGKDIYAEVREGATLATCDYKPMGPPSWVDDENSPYGPSEDIPIQVVNEWIPPKYDLEEGVAEFPRILREYFEYLMCGEDDQIDILLWLLYMYAHGKKTSNIFFWLGREGIGKTIFFQRFLSTLLGATNVQVVDFLRMKKSNFNSELEKLQVAFNDETRLDKETSNLLKSLTGDTFQSAAKFKTPEIRKATFSIHILANPDDIVVPLPPKSRRNIAFKLPEVQFKDHFGDAKAKEIYDSINDPEIVGKLARWLRQEYTPEHLTDGSEIRYKNPYYYELVIQSLRHSPEGDLVTAFIEAGKGGEVRLSKVKDFRGKRLSYEAVAVFLKQWQEAGLIVGKKVVTDKATSFISCVSSREDFLNTTGIPLSEDLEVDAVVEEEDDFDNL